MKAPKSLFGRKRGPIEFKPKEETKPPIPRILSESDKIRLEATRLALAMLAANTRKSLGSATTWETERVWP